MPRIHLPTDARRRAAILYVVVVLLTLFLVVGIAFVLYAESQATSARIYREATTYRDKYPTPEELLGWGLGNLIYDADDQLPNQQTTAFQGNNGIFSAARGHGLARTMYGWNYRVANQTDSGIFNVTPYGGAGRLQPSGGALRNELGRTDDFN